MTGMAATASHSYDVVVFGATSFVGRILARYLFETFGVTGDRLRWAAAGRSREKLEQLRRELGDGARRLELLAADAASPADLRKLCDRARVVVSTVGPYALYGEPLVATCAETGTDYCDLTGEPQWIRRMLDRYESTARRSGARIVHCCGFDSVPFDLGVHFLQREALARFGRPCVDVRMRVRRLSGGFSGGTVASMMNLLEEVAADPSLRRVLADHYALCPPGKRPKLRQHDVRFVEYDRDFDAWLAPFVMSAINTRIVHRTNALRGYAYGRDFRYQEAVLTGRGLRGRLNAVAVGSALGAMLAAGAVGPTRRALQRFVLPAPGQGPSPEAQRRGSYDLRFLGRTDDGRVLRTRVTGDRDPGYGSTARILGEAAACLALDVPKAPGTGGFPTTAVVFGDKLIERLRRHAGVTFEVLD
jgi:short subunit dehydrogenase-like uncharacterized protein